MSSPKSAQGRRAAKVLRVLAALSDQPEPNRSERRAAAKKLRKS